MEMIEKIGRALAAFADDEYAEHKEFWDRHVVVMLKAMREPTDAMIKAHMASSMGATEAAHVTMTLGPDLCAAYRRSSARNYAAMIDAAIAESVSEPK